MTEAEKLQRVKAAREALREAEIKVISSARTLRAVTRGNCLRAIRLGVQHTLFESADLFDERAAAFEKLFDELRGKEPG